MKTQIIVITMWIISAALLSINYPNLGGALFGTLFAGFIIHYSQKVGEHIGTKIWKFFKLLGDD